MRVGGRFWSLIVRVIERKVTSVATLPKLSQFIWSLITLRVLLSSLSRTYIKWYPALTSRETKTTLWARQYKFIASKTELCSRPNFDYLQAYCVNNYFVRFSRLRSVCVCARATFLFVCLCVHMCTHKPLPHDV